jgi:hypothetical protein
VRTTPAMSAKRAPDHPAWSLRPPGPAPRAPQPHAVTIVDIRLSWAAAIDIAFKFSVIFLAGQIIVVVILFALFG